MTSTLARRSETCAGLVLSLVVLAVVGFRLSNAGALWRDECAVIQLARAPTLGNIVEDFSHEAFPPPFPILIRVWANLFGTSDAALRFYGMAVAIALVASLWFVFRLTRTGIPLLSLGLIGLSSSFLVWGTSLRGYGIGAVCVLVALGAIGSLSLNHSRSAATVAVVAGVLSVQFLLQNTLLLLALAASGIAVCLIRHRWRRAWWIGAAVLVSELSFAPYVRSYLRAKDWSVVVESSHSTPAAIQQLGTFLGIGPSIEQWIANLCVAVVAAVAVQQLYARRHNREVPGFDLILFASLVFVSSFVVSEIFFRALNYTVQPWYLLAPFAIGLTGVDLMTAVLCQTTALRLVRVGTAIALAAILSWTNRTRLVDRQTNIDLIARTLEQQADPADLIVANPWQLGIPFQWYYRGPTAWVTLPQIDDHRFHRYDLLKQKMMSPQPLADVLELAANTLRSGHNIWLVGGARFRPAAEPIGPLPPAPQSRFGWDNLAYRWAWSEEFGAFINRHTLDGRRVPVDAGHSVNSVEDVPLVQAHGWKE